MKKYLLIILCLGISSVMMSQTFVSTTAENKNVVLEEFTGIHCSWCPAGHLIAQGIHDQNPGDVVLINIHTGTFATPSAGEPDFRTLFGDAIGTQSGVTAYPSGTVNRHVFPGLGYNGQPITNMARTNWSSLAVVRPCSFLQW